MSHRGGGPLVHHELCFGCGRTNLFGLLAEIEVGGAGRLTGRCFIKQDHQGPDRGLAHPGIVAAALIESLSLAAGQTPRAVEIEFDGGAPVGEFLELEATRQAATATSERRQIARASARYG